jgi:hypothetical protein
MPLDTKTASTLTLARQMLMDLDRAPMETKVLTATLELLLTTLVELGWPVDPAGVAAQRTVMGYATQLEEEGKAEREQQAVRANQRV